MKFKKTLIFLLTITLFNPFLAYPDEDSATHFDAHFGMTPHEANELQCYLAIGGVAAIGSYILDREFFRKQISNAFSTDAENAIKTKIHFQDALATAYQKREWFALRLANYKPLREIPTREVLRMPTSQFAQTHWLRDYQENSLRFLIAIKMNSDQNILPNHAEKFLDPDRLDKFLSSNPPPSIQEMKIALEVITSSSRSPAVINHANMPDKFVDLYENFLSRTLARAKTPEEFIEIANHHHHQRFEVHRMVEKAIVQNLVTFQNLGPTNEEVKKLKALPIFQQAGTFSFTKLRLGHLDLINPTSTPTKIHHSDGNAENFTKAANPAHPVAIQDDSIRLAMNIGRIDQDIAEIKQQLKKYDPYLQHGRMPPVTSLSTGNAELNRFKLFKISKTSSLAMKRCAAPAAVAMTAYGLIKILDKTVFKEENSSQKGEVAK